MIFSSFSCAKKLTNPKNLTSFSLLFASPTGFVVGSIFTSTTFCSGLAGSFAFFVPRSITTMFGVGTSEVLFLSLFEILVSFFSIITGVLTF